jgi:hypothetical protein
MLLQFLLQGFKSRFELPEFIVDLGSRNYGIEYLSVFYI